MTAVMPEAGPAGMLAGLRRTGYTVGQSDNFAVFDYLVEVGPEAGTTVRIGLELVPDWPLSAPHGPHITPPAWGTPTVRCTLLRWARSGSTGADRPPTGRRTAPSAVT